jgi:potassium channel subfamily K member 9
LNILSDALESETEKKRWEALQAIEDMILKKYKINQDDYKIIETVILKTEPHKAGKQWKFTGAFYYGDKVYCAIIKLGLNLSFNYYL